MSDLATRVKLIIFDWDETISESDTMSILARAVEDSAKWQTFVDQYVSDLEQQESIFGDRTSLEEQYKFLGSLSSVELASVKRIEVAKYFQGLTLSAVERAARNVKIRSGFAQFCRRLPIHVSRQILSVNWSQEFIKSGLSIAVDTQDWQITANRLDFDDENVCTGSVSKDKEGGIRTALDKLKHLQIEMHEIHKADGLLVYIGDSNTDLPSLLEADLGIIIGGNSSLQANCEKYGIQVLPLICLNRNVPYEKCPNKLFRAMEWDEVVF